MRFTNMMLAAAMCGVLGVAAPVMAQDKGAPAMDPAMEAMMKAGTPGAEHKMMADWVGSWSVKTKMMAPGAPPTEGTGSAVITSLFGGRYFQETFKGDMMGMPFEGLGTSGFDNVSKKFVGTWVDSMSTGIAITEGTWDAASSTFKYDMSYNDPVTGKVKRGKITVKVVDKNTHVSEFWDEIEGKWVKTMELTYTRK